MAYVEAVGYVCSRIAVFGWMLAGIYQCYLGYLHKEIGFSPMFLAGYVLGDICNVFGCFWGDQMSFQKVITISMLCTDSLMTLQHIYYKHKARTGRGMFAAGVLRLVATPAMFSIATALPTSVQEPESPSMDYKFLVGQIMAWFAEGFYVAAVIPQVWRNYVNKCTGGVSLFLFIADLVGSLGYVATIVAESQNMDTSEQAVQFLFDELAYLLGSTLCAIFDIILLAQYLVYPQFVEFAVIDGIEEEVVVTPIRTKERSYSSRSYGALK